MATNPLTGDYQAVFQIATRQIDALLASLHQNGAASDAAMQMPHSTRLSIGGGRRHPDGGDFADWVNELHRARRTLPASALQHDLVTAAPPGAATRLRVSLAELNDFVLEPLPVRGRADVQISNVTLTVPEGSTSLVVIHAHVRAVYRPAPGTSPLPAPIHGEVIATFVVQRTQSADGQRLVIKPTTQDAHISFHPAPGTISLGDAAVIAVHLRQALRQEFTLVPVDLPSDFPFGEFKGVGTGFSQALALGLQLTGTAPPTGSLHSVSQSFVGPAGFAFLVSKDFVDTVFAPTLDTLKAFEEHVEGFRVRVTDAHLEFNDGSMDLRIKAVATHPQFPDLNVSVRQRFGLVLFLDRLFISAPDDELSVSVSAVGIPLPRGRVRRRIIAARNLALPAAQNALNKQLDAARAKFDKALDMFDAAAAVTLRAGHTEESGALATGAIAITTNGIVVRGDLRLSPRLAPVVDVRDTPDETAVTALESWIPAGRINRFVWSWIEHTGPVAWSGIFKTQAVEHEFILPKPPGITNRSQICLRIEGSQLQPNGLALFLGGGTTCKVPVLEGIMNVPSWWEPVMLPIWRPDVAADAVLRDAIIGHVSVQTDEPAPVELTSNTLVFFAGRDAETPLSWLGEALKQRQRRGLSLVCCVVLPDGTFAMRRRELEARLGSFDERLGAELHLTEDTEGGWSRTFAPSALPAVFLLDARRRFVWKHEGALTPRELADAIDRRAEVAPPPRNVPLRLAVAPGDRMLDASFQDGQGEPQALHRLRGRRTILNFWQPWSAPCRRELERLRDLHESGKDRPLVIAFQGGAKTDLDRARKELGLPYLVVHDVDHAVARAYRVRCWPTTIAFDAGGRVEHVQFGATSSR